MIPTRARKVLGVSVLLGTLLLAGFVLAQFGYLPAPWSEDRAQVTVVGEHGTEKAVVDVEVADTWGERYTGLSEHDSLAEGEGMLFVHSSEDDRTYVMHDMDFDIDIIFVGEDRRINSIEHARAPEPGEDGEELAHSGQAQWVLEVPRGYANETGLEVGDRIEIKYH